MVKGQKYMKITPQIHLVTRNCQYEKNRLIGVVGLAAVGLAAVGLAAVGLAAELAAGLVVVSKFSYLYSSECYNNTE